MDPSEQTTTARKLHPFGFRIVIVEVPADDKRGNLILPEEVMRGEAKRGIVQDGGAESNLDPGALVYYRGDGTRIGDQIVLNMDQVIAWEDA